MSSSSVEKVKEYSSEFAGQRVGWVSFVPRPVPEQAGIVSVMTATVGENGAWLGTTDLGPDVDFRYTDQEGFLAIAGIHAYLQADKPHVLDHRYLVEAKGEVRTSVAEMFDGQNYSSSKNAEKVWSDDRNGVIETLKQLMQESGLTNLYSTAYYLLNGAIGETPFYARELSPAFESLSLSDLLLPDATMHDTTLEQVSLAEEIANLLLDSENIDESFIRKLDIPMSPSKISAEFARSRESLYELEQKIGARAAKMVLDFAVYSPIGGGSRAYSWPYLDAGEPNGFPLGPMVLQKLREKNTDTARNLVNYELSEVTRRQKHADEGLIRLREIAQSEI